MISSTATPTPTPTHTHTRPLTAEPLGDSAVTIRFGDAPDPALLARIHATARHLAAASLPNVVDIVPTYLSITVFYDPLLVSYAELAAQLLCISRQNQPTAVAEAEAEAEMGAGAVREHTILTRYNGTDLAHVAAAKGLSVDDVVTRHSGRIYTVDILGFVPGFAYLSELDPSLEVPRRAQPRPRVAAGSVAIAGLQTAVYPLDTPGGWHIIGHTEAVLFDASRPEPALLRAGDKVRFEGVQ